MVDVIENEEGETESIDESEEAAEDTMEEPTTEVEAISVDSPLEALDDELAFLSDENMSFYLANKAYYEDRDYEEAIQKFQAAIEYEKSQTGTKNFPAAPGGREAEPNDVIAKSMYWLSESYIKIRQLDKAVETLEQLARIVDKHYLSMAAERRLSALKASHPTLREESGAA